MSERVARLVRLLADAEAELAELTGGEVDAVVDPKTAAPILLRSAQARLAASEEKLRIILERCPVLVLELQRGGEISYCNTAVAATLGYPGSLISTHRFPDLVGDNPDYPDPEKLVGELFERGASDLLVAMCGAADSVHWIEWTTAPAASDRSILLFGVDVSHRRALLNEQIARSKAEAANRAKADFLAMVSHELRTPLNAIGGYSQLLEAGIAGNLSPMQMEYVTRIQRSQGHLLSMINDIIDFARLEAGKLSFNFSGVPVQSTVELCETLTTPSAVDKGIEISFRADDPDLTVWADKDKVQQVIVNLVTNAIKFTRPGGRIEVRAYDNGGNVHIAVSDNGAGIPKPKLEAIFQPFVQVESGHTRSRDGVGLGLAISRELARKMGGDLTVQSEMEIGSTFVLELPKPTSPTDGE